MQKKLSLFLAVLLLMMVPIQAMAAPTGIVTTMAGTSSFVDMPANWSTEAFYEATANGLLFGDNGKVYPNRNLTRAEMAAVMNRAFKATTKASLAGYVDVTHGWQYDEMSKAVGMEIFQGSGNKLFPNDMITREEAFVVLARLMNIKSSAPNKMALYDIASVSSWAKEEINGLINAGYIQGSKGLINPKAPITRAEFVQLMHNVIKTYVKAPGTHTSVRPGNVVVNSPDATLKNVNVTGDLIIAEGVGEGEVTLDNVNVAGRLLVRAGGENSIIIKGNSTVKQISINKNGKAVRILNETKKALTEVVTEGTSNVILKGLFKEVVIVSPDIEVITRDAKIDKVTIFGLKSELKVEKGSKIEAITIDAKDVKISGVGTVEDVVVKSTGSNSIITTPATIILVERGAKDVFGTGKEELKVNTEYQNGNSTKTEAKPVEENRIERPIVQKYAVSYGVVGSNGTLTSTVVSGTEVTDKTQLTFTATPAAGYRVKTWKLNGSAIVLTGNVYTLTVDKTTIVTVEFEIVPVIETPVETFDLKFEATPIDASIKLVNDKGAEVVAVAGIYKVPAGDYTYSVSKEGFISIEETITVSANVIITVALDEVVIVPEVKYFLEFEVTPVDAVVVMKDSSDNLITATEGTYEVPAGDYTYSVSKDGFLAVEQTITVSANAIITVALEEEVVDPEIKYFLDFLLDPVDAVVMLKDSSDNLIVAIIEGVYEVPAGDYTYSVSKEGFVTEDNTVTVSADATITVTLEEEVVPEVKYSLNFEVTPIDAVVVLKDSLDNLIVAIEGIYEVEAGDYTYSVSKDGFVTEEDTVPINADATVIVTLEEEVVPEVKYLLTFEVTPTDAVVELKDSLDNLVVATEGVFEVPAGDYTYSVSKEGFVTEITTITVSANETIVVTLEEEVVVNNLEITSVENLEPLEISVGDSFPLFPANVIVTLEDYTQEILNVLWDTSTFINEVGTQIITGEIELIEGITNSTAIKAIQEINITAIPDSYIAKNGELIENAGIYSTNFIWGSVYGIGSLNEVLSGAYGYYDDGAYLAFQVEDSAGNVVNFADIFQTIDDGNNTIGGMTLQTNGGNVNDMDGSNREKADWGVVGFEAFATTLPNSGSNLYYGVVQNATVGTNTVGFGAAEERIIDIALMPREDLVPGTYTVIIDAMQQNGGYLGSNLVYEFTIEEPAPTVFEVAFDVTPIDANVVLIDAIDQIVDPVDGVYSLEAGDYTYSVFKEGYLTEENTITVDADATITVTLEESTAPDSYLIPDLNLVNEAGIYKATFLWGSNNGIGSLNGTVSGAYTYYEDGAYLSFQVEDSTGTAVNFADVFQTIEDGNNSIGGMTLQTNGGNVNDMDGSNREKADWGVVGFEAYATNLPNDGGNLYYGVIQDATNGTKTVGFGAGEERIIDITLTPKLDLTPGTYTVIVNVMQQNGGYLLTTIEYSFTIE